MLSRIEVVPMKAEACHLLIVEDDPDDIYLIKELLRDESKRYTFSTCASLAECFEELEQHKYDLVLLDLGLPDSSGLATLDSLVAQQTFVPIVVLTGVSDENLGEQAIQQGAEDYLPKRIISRELLTRAISYAIERHRLVSELRTKAEQDPLTGLPNRSMIYDKLEFMISQSERSGRAFALVMLDMDKFKEVNDTKGHRFGDALLKAFAHRIKDVMRRSDYVARYGGDEFFMIVANYHDTEELKQLMQRKQQALSEPYHFEFDGQDIAQSVSVSVGAMEWEPGLSAEAMLERADQAMYRSKRKQTGSVTFV